MARRESKTSNPLPTSMDYSRGMEDMRRLMGVEMRKMEKLRTESNNMLMKERASWKSDRQQLLNEKRTLQRKLSVSEEANMMLERDLSRANERIVKVEEEISSLNHQHSALKEKHDTHRIILWRGLKKERQKAEDATKQRDELISLQQSLHAQKEDTERTGASVDESSWQTKVSNIEALLIEKDKEISRVTQKRRARTNAHIDTLALLNETQSALKQSKQTCDALEEKLRKQVSEREESYQNKLSKMEESFKKELSEKEDTCSKMLAERDDSFKKELSEKEDTCSKMLSERDDSFQKELSETLARSRKELSTLIESWERSAQQWEKDKRELEEMLLAKEETWIHKEAERKEEIQRLREENLQLQELMMKNKQKSFWSWSYKK